MRLIDADEIMHKKKTNYLNAACGHYDAITNTMLIFANESLNTLLEIAPTIDAKPVKHGEWTPDKVNEPTKLFYCSECKGLIELSHYAYKCYYNYCPTCGAEMDGVVTRR